MKDEMTEILKTALHDLGISDVSPVVTRSEESAHGDYATNVAMVLAKKLKKSPMEIAKEIQEAIIKHQKESSVPLIEKVEIASPGFINLFLSEAKLINQLGQVLAHGEPFRISPSRDVSHEKSEEKPHRYEDQKTDKTLASAKGVKTHQKPEKNLRMYAASGEFAEKKIAGQGASKKVMIEFADPNPFKEFHIGHLRNISLGESFSRLLEAVGYEIARVNYQGDVGMHVAKALWALMRNGELVTQISALKTPKEKAEALGKAYALGASAFEDPSSDGKNKKEIIEINKKVYHKDVSIVPLWEEGRRWSLEYFDTVYERVGTKFTRFYFESEVAPLGAAIVTDHIRDGIFEESEGAVVFRGEKYALPADQAQHEPSTDSSEKANAKLRRGLHTRVFLSKEGYATYEAKDLALAPLKYSEYPYDLSIIMTGNEQSPYFAVMLTALRQIRPELAAKTRHIAFGMVKLAEGKMSSRKGNVITAEWLIDQAKARIYDILKKSESKYNKKDPSFASKLRRAQQDQIAEKAAVAAVKYSMLKVTAASDISFDLEKSVSFDGDSGPYLQYTYARARSVLRKASYASNARDLHHFKEKEERELARLIGFFPEIVEEAAGDFAPNTLCTYLFGLAGAFNLFYAKHEILGNDLRLALTAATAQTLKTGLYLLGIEVLEQM